MREARVGTSQTPFNFSCLVGTADDVDVLLTRDGQADQGWQDGDDLYPPHPERCCVECWIVMPS